ncbi:MAG: PHP-associated domain-containing protein [Acidobacteriota bacterium]
MLKVDLHLHTREDPADHIVHDAYGLIERAATMGFGALAITLHDRQLADPRLLDYASDRGITLLPGIERTIEGKHVLLINFSEEAEQVRTFAGLAALKGRSNGLVIAPHPFFPNRASLRSRLDAHADLFDAVEWSYFWTGALNCNTRAASWANRHGKPLVGNSDLHDLRQLGRTYSLVFADREADAICDAIRNGLVSLQTEPAPAAELAQVVLGMLRRGNKRPADADLDIVGLAGAQQPIRTES